MKTIGDAIMCLFADADSAVNAAIEMHRVMALLRPGGLAIKVSIGLHAGPAVVGGDDVCGDTVNVAAYLADTESADQVLVTCMQFFIVEHSVNGILITRSDGAEIHLTRREMMLEGGGEIRPGYSRLAAERLVISFRCDRCSRCRVFHPLCNQPRSSERPRITASPSRPFSRACSGDSRPSAVLAIISYMSAAPSRMRGVSPVPSKVFAISCISGTQR